MSSFLFDYLNQLKQQNFIEGESITFAAGVHCFNFECLLPHEMPSTNVGKYGHIGYYVKAVLDIPWAIDKEFIAPFTFIKLENLNSWPNLQAPRSIHMKKSFCGIPLICGSGALLIQATIPVGGFIPGETIPVNIQIKNTSGISIPYTTTSLQIASEFVVDTPHVRTKNVKEKTLISVKGDGFPAHFSGNVTNNLIVPAVASSNVRCSRIFKVFYNLKITCKVNGFHLSPELSIPITIGNVPFTANNVVYDAALFPATAPASAPASAPTEPLNDLRKI